MKKITLSLILFFIILIKGYSQIVYVNYNATGLNNGTSWQDAFRSLSNAITSTTSGQIWVAQGTYKPTTDVNGEIPTNPRLNAFKLKINVAIYGGFNGEETELNQRDWENYPTILSGNIGDLNEIEDNVYNVFYCEYEPLNANTILDGLIIKDGYNSNPETSPKGGGIYVRLYPQGSFQIKNCIIEENYAEGVGGGIHLTNSNPIIENCIFRNNVAYRGGAMNLSTSDPVISNTQIINNFASYSFSYGEGGGIYLQGGSSPKISNSTLSDNYATYEGGAICNDSSGELILNNNIISGNFSREGGALFLGGKSYVFNNLIVNNFAETNGGAIYSDSGGNIQIINNTVVNNFANYGGGLYSSSSSPNITNTIFYDNSSFVGSQVYAYSNGGNQAPIIRYSHVQDGLSGMDSYGNTIVYQDNIEGDPLYTAVFASNNYRLLEPSLLIDAGTTSIFPTSWTGSDGQIINFPDTDLDGFQRIVGTIDIGAFEFGSTLGIHTSEKHPFNIYPNPSTGVFNISSNTNYDSFSIYNSQGIQLLNKSSESGTTSIDLTNYPSGIYYVHFLSKNKKYNYKIINK